MVVRVQIPSLIFEPAMPAAGLDDLPVPPGAIDWTNGRGERVGHCFRMDGDYILVQDQVGLFRFDRAAERVTVVPVSGTPRGTIEETFFRAVVPVALHVRHIEVLHASGVVVDGRIVALCGKSGAGKSTTALFCRGRGYPIWADDAVAFQMNSGIAYTPYMPNNLRVTPETAQALAHIRNPDNGGMPSSPAEIAAVVLLDRGAQPQGGGEITSMRLPPADAFRELLGHAFCFDPRQTTTNRPMVESYMTLVEHVPVHRLTYPHGFERLPEVIGHLTAIAINPAAAVPPARD